MLRVVPQLLNSSPNTKSSAPSIRLHKLYVTLHEYCSDDYFPVKQPLLAVLRVHSYILFDEYCKVVFHVEPY